MLEKTARKPSSDPAQEKLRQDKANWNKDISSFINDLIHLKKMMNGWPSKFYKERSRITQPIPADPNTIIGSLAGDFQQLAQKGESIVQEQVNYAKNRRQKQPKMPTAPAQTPNPATPTVSQQPPAETAQPDLAKQLAAWEQKYGEELVAQGSNKVTRTVTRLLNPTIGWTSGAKKRRYRMTMLKKATDVYKLLGKLQVKIVAPISNKESIKDAHDVIRKIKAQWDLVGESLKYYEDIMGSHHEMLSDEESKEELKKNEPPTPQEKLAPENLVPAQEAPLSPVPTDDFEVVSLAKDIKNDYAAVFKSKLGPEVFAALSPLINSFMKSPQSEKSNIARNLLTEYTNLLSSLKLKYGVNGNSLKEIEKAITEKEKIVSPPLPPGVNMPKGASAIDKTAQSFLRKWIGKTRHNVLPNDTSDYRLEIFDLAKDLRKEVNSFMDLAESRKTEIYQYKTKFHQISNEISTLNATMLKLYRLYYRVPKEYME